MSFSRMNGFWDENQKSTLPKYVYFKQTRCLKLPGVVMNYNSQACLHCRGKVYEFRQVRPSVRPLIRAQLPLDRFQQSFILRTLRKICPENPDLLKLDKNITGNLLEDLSKFYCCRRRQLTIKTLLCDPHFFVLLT